MSRRVSRRWPVVLCPLLAGVVCCAPGAWAGQRADEPEARGVVAAELDPARDPATPALRPDAARRVVRVFDFEEASFNPSPVPAFWTRAQDDASVPRSRPGFPGWNAAEMTGAVRFGGETSVTLPTRGGSTSLLLDPGVIPVFRGADYAVSAVVRTDTLREARAVLAARFLDKDGKALERTEARSTPLRTDGRWERVRVELPGDEERAAFLQLELLLLQSEQWRNAAPASGARPIHGQDFEGAAYFDDVVVEQLPRVELWTDAPGGVVVAGERAVVRAGVRDLTGERLVLRMRATDAGGAEVDSATFDLGAGQGRAEWSPRLERLGWYRVTMAVEAAGRVVARREAALALVAAPTGARGGAGSGWGASGAGAVGSRAELIVSELHPALAPVLAEVARRAGVAWVTLPAWAGEMDAAGARAGAEALSPTVEALRRAGLTVTLGLDEAPGSLSREARLRPSDVLALLAGGAGSGAVGDRGRGSGAGGSGGESGAGQSGGQSGGQSEGQSGGGGRERPMFEPVLEPYLDRFGQRVQRWGIARAGDAGAPVRRDLHADLVTLERLFSALVPGPGFALGWPAEFAPPRGASRLGVGEPASFVVLAPRALTPEGVGRLARAWAREGGADGRPDVTLVLEGHDPEIYGAFGAAQTVKRAVEAWAGASGRPLRVALRSPWTISAGRRAVVSPTPDLPALRATMDRLEGRVVLGELPTPAGVRALILGPATGVPALPTPGAESAGVGDALGARTRTEGAMGGAAPQGGGRGGAIVAWSEFAEGESAVLTLSTGTARPVVYDLFGNATPARVETPVDGPAMVRVALSGSPVFIEGIDLGVVRFLAGVRIDPARLAAGDSRQEHALVIDNPWPSTLQGRYTIVQPGGPESTGGARDRTWRIVPRTGSFVVEGGASARLPLDIAFSPTEESGVREFVIDFELGADRAVGVVRARTGVEIGPSELRLEVAAVSAGPGPGADVIVEATVINLGSAPVDAELTAFAPGLPRAKGSVQRLPPGRQAVRRFVFPGAAGALRGERALVTLVEGERGVRLNRSAVVE